MKKAISCIASFLLVCTMIGGCGKLETPQPSITAVSPSPIASQSPAVSQNPVISQSPEMPPSPSITATPGPTASAIEAPTKLSTNIPDVIFDPAEKNIQMSQVFEDEHYIYLMVNADAVWLLACNKNTGEVTKIDKDCAGFVYQDYMIYWCKEGEKGCSLISLDLRTAQSKQLKAFESIVNNLCIYGNKLYFVLDEKKAANDEPILNLYRMNTDGTSFEKLKDNVAGVCFYKDKMYYSPMYTETGAAIYEYDITTKAERKVTKMDNSLSFSAMFNHAKLVHRKMRAGDEILDLKTGETLDGFKGNYRAVFGQYFVYMYTTDQFTVYLKAYDTTTGKTYTLTEITDLIITKNKLFKYMAGTDKNIYLITLLKNGMEIYKLVIEGGKAKLVEVTKQ